MNPYVLIVILALLFVARVFIWFAPGVVPSDAQRAVVREYLDAFIIAGVVALVLMRFVVRTFWIPSGSMEPTLAINDVLLANEIQYSVGSPQDGQIAVFKPPPQVPDLGTTDLIKRVVAGPGDTLRIHDGIVYRNGKALKEPYLMQAPDYELTLADYNLIVDGIPLDPSRAVVPPRSAWQAPDRVPNGYYIMLGDNRNDSDDSHLWGFLPRAQFVGHAFFVFWPLARASLLH